MMVILKMNNFGQVFPMYSINTS